MSPLPVDRPGGRLAESVEQLDATRFVGRADVLAAIECRLADPLHGGVIFVHGPGGIGKSALLREIGRRARAQGVPTRRQDGAAVRELNADGGTGEAIAERLLLIDSFDQLGPHADQLRESLVARLAASTLVVIASRERPAAAWFLDGWEHVVSEVMLAPLSDAEADELLARHDIHGARASDLRRWAHGSPLALHVAATRVGDPPAVELAASLAHRLVGDDLGELDRPVIAVAAVAREVTVELVRAMFPGRDVRTGLAQLHRLSRTDSFGGPLALPETLRHAVRAELRRHDVAAYRNLVVRLADHFHQRVLGGEYWLMDDLTALIEDPAVRWGYTRDSGAGFGAAPATAADADDAAHALGARDTQWWAGIERYFHEAPDSVTVVRGGDGALAGFSIVTTPARAPHWAFDDIVLGPALAHARRQRPGGDVLLYRDSFDLTAAPGGDPASPVVALLNSPPQLAEDIPYAQRFYGVVDMGNRPARELARAVGAIDVPELSVVDGERRLGTYVLDHGPGGVVGAVHAIVRAEQAHPVSRSAGRGQIAVDRAGVREALRRFHDPVALAGHPLATGSGVAARAYSVQRLLRGVVATAFGRSEGERRLRRLIEQGYLDPAGGHRNAMRTEHLSRSSYYRHLSEAVARVADVVASS